MLEKLTDLSRLLLIPASILYFFGFLCITGYFARFGIVTFDIFNARYLIAGFYPLIALGAVIFLAWDIYSKLPITRIFDWDKWIERGLLYVTYTSTILFTAIVATTFFNIGEYKASTVQPVTFAPLLRGYDFIGQQIDKLYVPVASADFLIKATLYSFSYLFLLLLLIVVIAIILPQRTKSTTSDVAKTSENKPVDPVERKEPPSKLAYFFVCTLDVFFISAFASLFVFSVLKISNSIVDFYSFESNFKLTVGLTFSWIYTSILTVYIFLNFSKFPSENIVTTLFEKYTKLENLQFAMQQIVLPVLTSLLLFGATIFPRIPDSMGGGQPRRVDVQSSVFGSISSSTLYLLGENSEFIFLVRIDNGKAKAIELNKDQVDYITTRQADITE